MAETVKKGQALSRRTITILASLTAGAVIIALLAYERVDILYLLATIALVALLAMVATSDLEGKTKNIEN